MEERVRRLKEIIMEAPETLCLERGRIYTEIYKENEDKPFSWRRAISLASLLDRMTIYIQDGELIVGNFTSRPGALALFPEYTFQDARSRYKDYENEKTVGESGLSDKEARELIEIMDYWRGRSVHDRADAVIPADVQKARDHNIGGKPYGRDEGHGHIVVDYELAITKGFRYLIDRSRERLDSALPSDPPAYEFLRSVIIVLEAVIRFAHRFADEAERLAASETNPMRREELTRIAAHCRHIPEYPARNFWEACQSFWFIHLVMHLEQNGFSISPGRFDQYTFPLYKKDMEDGSLSREKALTILECLFVKFMEISTGGVKISLTPTLTLAGSDISGRDLTNEVTYLCVKAAEETRMVQPQLTIRWHRNIDRGIMNAVLEAIKKGAAPPAFLNEEVIIHGLVKIGIPREDAQNFAQEGCNETGIPGKLIGGGIPRGVSLVKCVELAMDGGVSRYSGEQVGVRTKRLGEYVSFEEFLDAYRLQVEHFSKVVAAGINMMDHIHREMVPLPFASSLMSGTIERGRDIMVETDYFHLAMGCTDFIPALNSLCAVRKAVFEEGMVSQEDLAKALADNFEGHDEIRKKLWIQPKFGNDDNSVDSMIPVLERISREAIKPYRSYRKNTEWVFENIPRIAHISEGMRTKATPDGRYAGESLAAGISAQIGTDIQGPTALLNSFAKIDPDHWVGGVISNMRLHPGLLKDKAAADKVVLLLNAYFKKGGQHLQLNCVSREILADAQLHPENYRDLIVRVSGYCDYFTNLNRNSQEDIIRRTEVEM